MIDPLTLLAVPAVYGVYRLTNARAEAVVLGARARLIQASAQLPPGTEITGAPGDAWRVRVPLDATAADEH